jgi:hypothetical protein
MKCELDPERRDSRSVKLGAYSMKKNLRSSQRTVKSWEETIGCQNDESKPKSRKINEFYKSWKTRATTGSSIASVVSTVRLTTALIALLVKGVIYGSTANVLASVKRKPTETISTLFAKAVDASNLRAMTNSPL